MGQNFEVIMIKRKEKSDKKEIEYILNKLNESFEKDKDNLNFDEFSDEIWGRRNERLIGFYFNERIIIVEDNSSLIKYDLLKDISEVLNTEVISIQNSDTVDISMITIYDRGKLIRKKSLGLENDLDMLSGEELQSVEGIGEPTIYEKNGSHAVNVYHSFIEGKIDFSEPISITIYKKNK